MQARGWGLAARGLVYIQQPSSHQSRAGQLAAGAAAPKRAPSPHQLVARGLGQPMACAGAPRRALPAARLLPLCYRLCLLRRRLGLSRHLWLPKDGRAVERHCSSVGWGGAGASGR